MMRSTLGAPLGGTMRGGHHGVESVALSLITPPNFGGGGGSCFPSSEVVALGEPRTPVTFGSSMLFSLCFRSFVISYSKSVRLKCSRKFQSCAYWVAFPFACRRNVAFSAADISFDRKKLYLQPRLQIAPVGLIRTWKAGGAFLGNVGPTARGFIADAGI